MQEAVVKTISYERESGMKFHVTEVETGQSFLVVSIRRFQNIHQTASEAYTLIGDVLVENGMSIVHERIFGSLSAKSVVMSGRAKALKSRRIYPDGPVTYVEGRPAWSEGLAGIIISAISTRRTDGDISTIREGIVPVGKFWERGGISYIALQNLQGRSNIVEQAGNRCERVSGMIDQAQQILGRHNMSYQNVIRTWFYLADILKWYDRFNNVRNWKHDEHGVASESGNGSHLAASTAVGGRNEQNTTGSLDLLAVAGSTDSHPVIETLANPVQQEAFKYGSAFSRGTLIRRHGTTQIHVSGTAAIDEKGDSLYPGDICGQIDCTFDKVEALIEQEGATLEDICSATVFVKRPEYAGVFWERAAERGLAQFPAVCVVADICREELLFEIDAEVILDRRIDLVTGTGEREERAYA